jgi:hypothetical protein
MDYLDGDAAAWWKPGPRAKAAVRTALDFVFPPQSLDDGVAPMTNGFNAEAWTRIPFVDGPLCDGCGQPVFHLQNGTNVESPCGAWP